MLEYFIRIFLVAPVLNPQFLGVCSFNLDDIESKNIEDDLNNFASKDDLPPNPPGKE